MTKTQQDSKPKRTRIEKGVPLPKYTKMAPKYSLVEDLQKMEPEEDSIPLDVEATKENLNSTRTRIYEIVKDPKNKLKGRRYTVNIDPTNKTRLRVWRVV